MSQHAMIYKIAVVGTCPTGDRSEVQAGRHGLTIDEPPERGGTDLGASPLETLLASLLGCTNVISHRIAAEMGIRLELVAAKVIGLLDGRVLKGEQVPAVFSEIRLDLQTRTDASEEQLAELRRQLARRCPVSVILQNAGTKILDRWSVLGAPVGVATALTEDRV